MVVVSLFDACWWSERTIMGAVIDEVRSLFRRIRCTWWLRHRLAGRCPVSIAANSCWSRRESRSRRCFVKICGAVSVVRDRFIIGACATNGFRPHSRSGLGCASDLRACRGGCRRRVHVLRGAGRDQVSAWKGAARWSVNARLRFGTRAVPIAIFAALEQRVGVGVVCGLAPGRGRRSARVWVPAASPSAPVVLRSLRPVERPCWGDDRRAAV